MSMVILVNDQPGGFDYGAVVLFEGPEMEPRAEYSALPLIVEKVGTGGVDGCEFCREKCLWISVRNEKMIKIA